MKLSKEDCWKILNGECTLPEAMKVFGVARAEIDKTIAEIKNADKHDCVSYFAYASIFSKAAYERLIELNEFDCDKMFNMAAKKYDDGNAAFGDIGVMGVKSFRYVNSGWEYMD